MAGIIINIILTITTFALIMIFHLHMFQLNSYKVKEEFTWIGRKRHEIIGRILFLIPAVIGMIVNVKFINWIALLFVILTAFINKPKKAKISLKYTKRVQRLILTISIIFTIGMVLTYIQKDYLYFQALLYVMMIFMPYLVIIANWINKPIEKGISNYYINDARKVISSMDNLITIGITGSYGKTSMKYILNEILSTKFNVLMTPGNYNTTLGVTKTIRESLRPIHQVFICEMGARNVGDIEEIAKLVCPKYGIITSIGEQHLESFKSIDNIIKTKFELIDNLTSDGIAILNYENGFIKNREVGCKFVSYGFGDNVDFMPSDISITTEGSSFIMKETDGSEVRFKTPLIGTHNVLNIAGAIAVASILGVRLESMKKSVKRLKAVPHRLELVKNGDITIIDDAYNSNPSGAKKALETLNMLEGYRIVITPGMVELGQKEEELNRIFGMQIAEVADYVVLVGEKQTRPIYDGICSRDFDMDNIYIASSFEKAMEKVRGIKTDKAKVALLENDLPDNY